ncbi:hypothetical protein B1F79_05380 [Coxiella-like endosymbiont of Rhipicephalus sanguineus]|uniref:hypothetical protein n=1 Tax=Coxiella-like endosymbiont of Rhipicephalus sanguineus TaxID=1955402 RepID=UPI0020407AA5|nr:hypothetical protein [Coxiella-like endosymbiont of Rhipicephalus sanguineus]MBT8506811.1 hypothetical protein [Coxiella-like endosymbiont of Rhipicephalus sanguineus]
MSKPLRNIAYIANSGYYDEREFPIYDIKVVQDKNLIKYGWIKYAARRVATRNVDKDRVKLKRNYFKKWF